MSNAATISGMSPRKPKNAKPKTETKTPTQDRHVDFLMMRFKKGLMYRLKRIAEEQNREATRQATQALWEHVFAEEERLSLAPITAEEIAFLSDKKEPLSQEEIQAILKSAKDDEPKRLSRKTS